MKGKNRERNVITLDPKRSILSFSSADGVLRLAVSKGDLADVLHDVGPLTERGSTVVMHVAGRDVCCGPDAEVLESSTYSGVRQIARAGQNLPEPYYKFVCVVPAYLLVVQRLEQNATA